MLYRSHRGSLKASMDTVKEINNIQELKDHIDKENDWLGFKIEEIKLKHIGYDERIKWDTHYVLIKVTGQDYFYVAGMTNGNF